MNRIYLLKNFIQYLHLLFFFTIFFFSLLFLSCDLSNLTNLIQSSVKCDLPQLVQRLFIYHNSFCISFFVLISKFKVLYTQPLTLSIP